jgi:hypothetical protein
LGTDAILKEPEGHHFLFSYRIFPDAEAIKCIGDMLGLEKEIQPQDRIHNNITLRMLAAAVETKQTTLIDALLMRAKNTIKHKVELGELLKCIKGLSSKFKLGTSVESISQSWDALVQLESECTAYKPQKDGYHVMDHCCFNLSDGTLNYNSYDKSNGQLKCWPLVDSNSVYVPSMISSHGKIGPFEFAALYGYIHMLKWFAVAKKDSTVPDTNIAFAIQMAALNGHLETVVYLIDYYQHKWCAAPREWQEIIFHSLVAGIEGGKSDSSLLNLLNEHFTGGVATKLMDSFDANIITGMFDPRHEDTDIANSGRNETCVNGLEWLIDHQFTNASKLANAMLENVVRLGTVPVRALVCFEFVTSLNPIIRQVAGNRPGCMFDWYNYQLLLESTSPGKWELCFGIMNAFMTRGIDFQKLDLESMKQRVKVEDETETQATINLELGNRLQQIEELQTQQRNVWDVTDKIALDVPFEHIKKQLCEHTVPMAEMIGRGGAPTVHLAAAAGRTDLLEWLALEMNMELTQLDAEGRTVMEIAEITGSISTVECIISLKEQQRRNRAGLRIASFVGSHVRRRAGERIATARFAAIVAIQSVWRGRTARLVCKERARVAGLWHRTIYAATDSRGTVQPTKRTKRDAGALEGILQTHLKERKARMAGDNQSKRHPSHQAPTRGEKPDFYTCHHCNKKTTTDKLQKCVRCKAVTFCNATCF